MAVSRIHPHLTTMDTLTGVLAGSDMDAEMTALTPEETTEQNFDTSDEVEHLQNRYMCRSYSCIFDFIAVLFCGISMYSIVSFQHVFLLFYPPTDVTKDGQHGLISICCAKFLKSAKTESL